jgi:hypothetical protein
VTRARCGRVLRVGLVVLLLGFVSAAAGCEGVLDDEIAKRGDPGGAGARAMSIDDRDAYGNPPEPHRRGSR